MKHDIYLISFYDSSLMNEGTPEVYVSVPGYNDVSLVADDILGAKSMLAKHCRLSVISSMALFLDMPVNWDIPVQHFKLDRDSFIICTRVVDIVL